LTISGGLVARVGVSSQLVFNSVVLSEEEVVITASLIIDETVVGFVDVLESAFLDLLSRRITRLVQIRMKSFAEL